MIMAYKIEAEIVNAYDDSIESMAPGIIEIQKCNACDHAQVTAVICDHAAQAKGEAHSFKDLDIMAHEAVFRAAIESGENAGCQLGAIRYVSEIHEACQGMALGYL